MRRAYLAGGLAVLTAAAVFLVLPLRPSSAARYAPLLSRALSTSIARALFLRRR